MTLVSVTYCSRKTPEPHVISPMCCNRISKYIIRFINQLKMYDSESSSDGRLDLLVL